MKPEQSVYNKLHKFSAKEEPMKVELGAFDDLNAKYKSIASKALPIKKIIADAANDLKKVSNDLLDVSRDAKRLQEMAKELGADNIVELAKAQEAAAASLSKGWGKASDIAERAAKEI
jgi:uncharacterized coiled-coil DUF342 family protein